VGPRSDRVYRVTNVLGRTLLRALRVDVRIHGLERVPTQGPVVVASTHNSFLDFVMLEYAAAQRGRFVRFLARHDVWDNRAVGRAMTAMGHVPVDRAAPAAAYLHARGLLRAGEAVGVFPEAGISHSFQVRALMPGAVALALETGAPLVPVAMWGAQRISTAGDPTRRPDLTRGRTVDISIGAPLTVPADVVAGTRILGATLQGLLDPLQAMGHHQPDLGVTARWHPAHLGGHAPTPERAALLGQLPRSAVDWH
jgi:1-acyl-sn-glycerol-3-phosphate acyltransferase